MGILLLLGYIAFLLRKKSKARDSGRHGMREVPEMGEGLRHELPTIERPGELEGARGKGEEYKEKDRGVVKRSEMEG